jgi:hypothetical protein
MDAQHKFCYLCDEESERAEVSEELLRLSDPLSIQEAQFLMDQCFISDLASIRKLIETDLGSSAQQSLRESSPQSSSSSTLDDDGMADIEALKNENLADVKVVTQCHMCGLLSLWYWLIYRSLLLLGPLCANSRRHQIPTKDIHVGPNSRRRR